MRVFFQIYLLYQVTQNSLLARVGITSTLMTEWLVSRDTLTSENEQVSDWFNRVQKLRTLGDKLKHAYKAGYRR